MERVLDRTNVKFASGQNVAAPTRPGGKKLPAPRPPVGEYTTQEPTLPPTTYKTSKLRRERFKKPPTCKSAPLGHRQAADSAEGICSHSATNLNGHPQAIGDAFTGSEVKYPQPKLHNLEHTAHKEKPRLQPNETVVKPMNTLRKLEPGDCIKLASYSQIQVPPPHLDPNPVISYITSTRLRLGLDSQPEKNPLPSERESLVASSKPITGVKDLKLLSRKLSSLQTALEKSFPHDGRSMDSESALVDFVYCLRRDLGNLKMRLNPYDLRIVSSETARAHKRYYTVSALSVAKVECDGSMELTPVPRWLWEREMFYRLLNIPCFTKFKLWRAFVTWRKWICSKKFSAHKSALQSQLFSADVQLQKALLHVRYLCEMASPSGSNDKLGAQPNSHSRPISLLKVDLHTTYSLEGFLGEQGRVATGAKESLKALREEIVTVVLIACKTVAESEGICGLEEGVEPEEAPPHARVLEWRRVLERLRRFVQLCNSIILEMLQRMVLKAVGELEHCIVRAIKGAASCAREQEKQFQRMFEQVLSQPHTQGVRDRLVYTEDEDEGEEGGVPLWTPLVSSFIPTANCNEEGTDEALSSLIDHHEHLDLDTNKDDVSDPITLLLQKHPEPAVPLWEVHLVLRKENETMSQIPNERATSEQASNEVKTVVDKRKGNGEIELSSSYAVLFIPSAGDFNSALSQLLKGFEAVIGSFVSLLQDSRILPYVSRSKYDLLMLLEESAAGGTKAQPWPDFHSLLWGYTPYQACVCSIERSLKATMAAAERYSKHYWCFSEMVESCSEVDITASMKERKWTVPMFQRALALYHDQVHAMKGMVLSFWVGMVRGEGRGLHRECLAYPQGILLQLEYWLPHTAHTKAESLTDGIKTATDKLLNTPMDVESFVQYLDGVEEVAAAVPPIEQRLLTLTNLYNVAQEFEVPVPEEQLALYKALFPQFRYLKNLLLQAEATRVESVPQFSRDLKSCVTALLHQARELMTNIESPSLMEESYAAAPARALQQLQEYGFQVEGLLSQAQRYLEYHQRFGTIPTSRRHFSSLIDSSHSWTPKEVYEEILTVQHSLQLRQTLFQAWENWGSLVERWSEAPLTSLDLSQLQREVNGFVQTVDYLERGLSANQLVGGLREAVVSFRSLLPTLSCLLNSALRMRHWEAIEQSTGGSLGQDRSGITIRKLQEMKAFEYHSTIATVSNQASHEATLEEMLKKVSGEWVFQELTLVPHHGPSGRQVYLLGGVEDLLASLEDSLSTLATVKSSKYVEPIKHAVLDWEGRLSLLLEVVEQWVLCQRNWLYLESIFAAVDIQRQLSNEAKLFLQADKSWREVTRMVADKPTALKAANTPGVLEAFQTCNTLLEQVFKSLEDYLESKRLTFPRFCFISDSELLDIMAHIKNPAAVQPYLSKLFANIKRLEFSGGTQASPAITAMVSTEGERIELPTSLYARGSPEQWLDGVEKTMVETVKRLLKAGVTAYDSFSREQWALEHPGQVVLTAAEIDWTRQVEACLQSSSPREQLQALYDSWVGHLEDLASSTAPEGLPAAKHCTLTAVLTLDVHRRDIILSLMKSGISSASDFEWLRHLRYYWFDEESSCQLQQCFASFSYGNEYLGCLPRLVVTPLSERCYLTLTTALHLHLGGSPIGPAGTGKSETVKDLAKAMGKLCLVFNCSEGLNYKIMGRLFSGMCQSGAWCCFDEFNRIDLEVLSVVAQQLQCIKAAKHSGATRFLFEDREVKLVPSCAAFITMNPGYAGRVELPDNLKSLFRPVAMMVPDTAMIAEVLLFTQGFTTAPTLAQKLTKLYEMAAVQLSQQMHYDFGLRAVKAVILLAGDYLQKDKRSVTAEGPELEEKRVLLHALRDSNLPKLITDDVQIMNPLLADLFPGEVKTTADKSTASLKDYLESAVEEDEGSLQLHPSQTQKCLHLYSTLLVRHGVMLLGPTGGGKTTVLRLLKTALNRAHRDHYGHSTVAGHISLSASLSIAGSITEFLKLSSAHCQMKTINPKCLSLGELYGHYDPVTLEWRSGVLARTLQIYSRHAETTLQASQDKDNNLSQRDSGPDFEENAAVSDGQFSLSQSTVDKAIDTSCSSVEEDVQTAPGLPYPPCAPVGWKWLVLDGPVDPAWVENLNSTLDDSKVLCLANGERIELHPGMRVLFETDELSNASPATVSRCGMVYMDPTDLGWRPYVLTWMKTLPQDLPQAGKDHLLALFEQSVDRGLQFLRKHATELSCPVPGISAVTTLCRILAVFLEYISRECGGFIPKLEDGAGDNLVEESTTSIHRHTLVGIYIPTKQHNFQYKSRAAKQTLSQKGTLPYLHRNPECLLEFLGKLFVFAFTWSFGGCLQTSGSEEEDSLGQLSENAVTRGGRTARPQFDALVHEIFSESSSKPVKLPTSADLIFSYYVDINSGSFTPWAKLVPSSKEIVTRASIVQKGLRSLQMLSSSSMLSLDAVNVVGKLHNASEVGLVPTVDTVRVSFFVHLLQQAGHHALLSGKMGVGKTQLLSHLTNMLESRDEILPAVLGGKLPQNHPSLSSTTLGKRDGDNDTSIVIIPLHVSSQTTSSFLQLAVEKQLVRKSKSTFGAPSGKRVVVCLDDLNMASPDSYGSQPCAELLRQLMGGGGWYDRKSLAWKGIDGVTVLATVGGRGWGYHDLNQRCLSKFSLFCLPEPSTPTLHHIFSTHVARALTSGRFPPEVVECVPQLVSSAVHSYQEVRAQLLPSPLKPQYTFCTRDLAKVFTGLLRVRPKSVQSKEEAIRLVTHELMRVLHDRCLPLDREQVLVSISDALRIHFKISQSPSQLKEQVHLYEDFTDSITGYSAVKNTKKLVKHLERVQNQYNIAEDKNSQLVFFPLACENVVRVARVLQQPAGHLVMLGVGGVGRRSCVQLASYIAHCKYHELTPAYKSSTAEYQDEIKTVLQECGLAEQSYVLLATETAAEQIMLFHTLHELMLCGEEPRLFEKEEVEAIVSQVGEKEGYSGNSTSQQELWRKFIGQVRHNLHIVLCFSPSSRVLSELCRTYPNLVTLATVNVYDEWPAKALYGVALKELHSHSLMMMDVGSMLKDMQGQVATACVKIHGTVLSASEKAHDTLGLSFPVTPSSFIHFVHTSAGMLQRKHERISANRSHLEVGLQQLGEADERVAGMKGELEQLRPEIQRKTEEAEGLLEQLSSEQEKVEALRSTVEQERAVIAQETAHVASLAEEAEADLKSVLPVLQEAERGLNALKKTDLLEIRSYATPPSMVMHVMSAVCVLLGEPTDWSTVKHLMADPLAFLRRLTSFNKDSVPDRTLSKLKKYTRDPTFSPEKVAHYSVACKSFCQWVLAIEHYARVYRVVQPKRQLHQEIGMKLEAVRSKLQVKEAQLQELEAELSQLRAQYSSKVAERNALQEKHGRITAMLRRAETLTKCLADEQVRWHETLESLGSQSETLLGDSVLMAACLVYGGRFTPTYRQTLLSKWKHTCQENKLHTDTQFSLEENLVEPERVQVWYAQGLPKDAHSVQSASVISQCEKCPLIIDPEGQATRWLKALHTDSGLVVLSYSSTQLLKLLEEAAKAGLPVLIEDIPAQVGSVLDPFLLRNTSSSEGQLLLRIDKTEIEYNPSFRLFLICKEANPKLTSELCNKTTVVNFSATFEGLQDQLLSTVINLEEPTLELQFSELLLDISSNKKQLRGLEHRLLDMLKSSSGNILDNEELVMALQEAKQVATDVEEHLFRAQQTKDEVSSTRHHFQPVATRGSVLYFCLQELKHLSPMYQFSLEQFQTTFVKCIQETEPPRNGGEKYGPQFRNYVTGIIQHLTRTVYEQTSSTIFSEHHLPFALKLCCSILMHGDEILGIKPAISRAEWLVFANNLQAATGPEHKGGTALSPVPPATGTPQHTRKTCAHHRKYMSPSKQKKLHKPECISDDQWEACFKLERANPSFTGLQANISQKPETWKGFVDSANPESFISDHDLGSKDPDSASSLEEPSKPSTFCFSSLSPFQKLLLAEIFHPQHLSTVVRRFIRMEMGLEYTFKPPLDLVRVFRDSNSRTPVLFILAPGTDPTASLQQLARQVWGDSPLLESISLGQGQGERASELIWFGAQKGQWVFLQNCHLAASWMPQLEGILKSLHGAEVHPEFRLWLSSQPSISLPSSILQTSIKVSLESPKSVRDSLQQLIAASGTPVISREVFEDQGCGPAWRQLVFSLCLFHAAANGRKVYGSRGWNVPYGFSPADVKVTVQMLHELLSESPSTPWLAVHHLAGAICYGGRVTDAQDMCCLQALLRKFCSPEAFHDHSQSGLTGNKEYMSVRSTVTYSECCSRIENLPVEDVPGIFGLHPSLSSELKATKSRGLLSCLHTMEFPAEVHKDIPLSHNSYVLEKASELLEHLPQYIELPNTLTTPCTALSSPPDDTGKMQLHSPFWILLSHEISQWNNRLKVVSTSLHKLVAAARSEAAILEEEEALYHAFASDTIPKSWQFQTHPGSDNTTLDRWFKQLQDHYTFVANWATMNMDSPPASDSPKLPTTFQLAALSSPKGLFAVVAQGFSRIAGVPLENVELKFAVADSAFSSKVSRPERGVILTGLHLEGAQWSPEKGLVEAPAASDPGRLYAMPDVICYPVEAVSSECHPSHQEYSCPLYSSVSRECYITSVPLPTSEQPNHWTLQSVALFAEIRQL